MRTTRLVCLLLISLGSLLDAAPAKLSSDLTAARSQGNVRVIVRFKSRPAEEQHRKLARRGAVLTANLTAANSAVYSVPSDRLTALAQDEDVEFISPDRPVRAAALDYALVASGAIQAQQLGFTGAGIGVAVIDSGVNNISDLREVKNSRIVYSENFVPGTKSAADGYGHGTHVAGIIASNGGSSTCPGCFRTFQGVAPRASIINLRVLDDKGVGSDSSVIAAIDRAISLKSRFNIRVINLSLGRAIQESYRQDPLCQAVERAWQAGIVVVAAAGNLGRDNSVGNEGYGTITSPGNDPFVITVGAAKTMETPGRSDDLIASYSSKGPTAIDHIVKPDLIASGNRMISTLAGPSSYLPTNFTGNIIATSTYKTASDNGSNAYYRLSGTSMAAPMVSGAAILLLEQNPNLTPDQVKARLMKTAYKVFPTSSVAVDVVTGKSYRSYYDAFTIGTGLLDIAAALENRDIAQGSAQSPKAVYSSTRSGTTVSMVFDSSVVWGTSVLWGTSVVWGTNVTVSGTSLLWGTSVVWGTSTNQATSVLWGTGILWGTSRVTGESIAVAILGEN